MFVEDLRKEFYSQLLGKQVLMLANHDVDSLCACKILQRLFQDDGVFYTIKPIRGIEDMRVTYLKLRRTIDVLVLINCGASVDVMDILDKPSKPIYIIDSHKPIHILNIYDESKLVRVVSSPEENANVPAFDEIFRQDDDDFFDEDEDDESDEGEMEVGEDVPVPGEKRKRGRMDPAALSKRKQFREWEQKRQEILYDYSKYTSYGSPASLTALELAWKLSRDQTQIIWWAAVSLTESFLLEKLPRASYLLLVTQLQDHVARVSHAQNIPRDSLKVVFENELCLLMYRHWNLYDSIRMTPYCASKFRSWCYRGEQRYHEFLADAGLPLSQVRETFTSMDLSLRRILKDTFCSQRIRTKYRFDEITVGTFTAQIGYQSKYNALDTALGAIAVLESPKLDVSASDNFFNALDFLNNVTNSKMDIGLNMAKVLVTAVYKEVQTICDLNQLLVFGSFMCVQVQPGVDVKYFCQPNAAKFLVQFVTKAVVASRKDRQLYQLPMVIMTPQDDDFYLILGIPPLAVDTNQSILGRAFEQVAKNMKDSVIMDYFDPCVLQVKAAEKQVFLDSLLLLLM